MGQAAPQLLMKWYSGAIAHGGGTLVCDYPIPIDRVAFLTATIGLSALAATHLTAAGVLLAYYIVENKNGTLSTVTALTGSTNPDNAGALAAFDCQAADAFFNSGGGAPPTGVWTISSTNARLTVTNNAIANDGDCSVLIQAILFGST